MSPTESKPNPSTPLYFYGAAVQGIQGFIFQTNELKDIVGASELVEEICTQMFEDEFKQDGELIVSAAGNIKCLFYSQEQCQKAVLLFPKMVMEAAPGITISQAVVETTQEQVDSDFQSVVDKLESKLHAQRNKASKSIISGLMGIERSRRTGLPAVKVEKDDFLDLGTFKKKKRSEGSSATITLAKKSFGNNQLDKEQLALDIEKLTDRNDWIAIIHADGNGLGEFLANKGGNKKELSEFSSQLSEATIAASQLRQISGSRAQFPFSGQMMTVQPVPASASTSFSSTSKSRRENPVSRWRRPSKPCVRKASGSRTWEDFRCWRNSRKLHRY